MKFIGVPLYLPKWKSSVFRCTYTPKWKSSVFRCTSTPKWKSSVFRCTSTPKWKSSGLSSVRQLNKLVHCPDRQDTVPPSVEPFSILLMFLFFFKGCFSYYLFLLQFYPNFWQLLTIVQYTMDILYNILCEDVFFPEVFVTLLTNKWAASWQNQ